MRTGRYTEAEDTLIKEMLHKGSTYHEIASMLGRSWENVRQRIITLRKYEDLPPAKRKDYGINPYTVQEEATIIAMYKQGHTMPEIARTLKRTQGSVKDKIFRLRNEGVLLKPRRNVPTASDYRADRITAKSVHHQFNLATGKIGDLLFKGETVTTEVLNWMCDQAVNGGYPSLSEWMVDVVVDKFYEEKSNG